VLYLLDANVMIRAHEDYYPLDRIPQFWAWLVSLGVSGMVKVPYEIYGEIAVSTGPLHDWLTDNLVAKSMLLDQKVDPKSLNIVITQGYAPDLDDSEIEEIGRDPFLIAYGLNDVAGLPLSPKRYLLQVSSVPTGGFQTYVRHSESAALTISNSIAS
jgi:hypothetical protein